MSMPVDTKILASLDLFSDFDTNELEKVSPLMHQMKVTEGEELFRRGSNAHSFFIILSGSFMMSFAKDRAFTLHKKGQIMGWSTIVTPFQYTATSTALTKGAVLFMQREDFTELLQGDAKVSDKIMKKINGIISDRMSYFSVQKHRAVNKQHG
jgi:CRP-like cAMP-binding protein